MKEKITKGYKAFNKEWKCQNKQYKVGKTYTLPKNQKMKICNKGFHFCKQGVDVLEYYPNFLENKYALIEAIGEVTIENNKSVCRKIKIVKEVSKEEIIRSFESTSTTGDYAHSSTTGKWAHSSTTGNEANSITTGYRAHSSTTGKWAHSITTGNEANSITTGKWAHSSTTGKDSVSIAAGINSKALAIKGFITIANWIYKKEWQLKSVHSVKVGQKLKGIKIKPNHWYWFEDDKLMEE